jgi:predicted nucleic acid-binding protein
MKVPDLNLLIYAANEHSAHHQLAKQWFEDHYNTNHNPSARPGLRCWALFA